MRFHIRREVGPLTLAVGNDISDPVAVSEDRSRRKRGIHARSPSHQFFLEPSAGTKHSGTYPFDAETAVTVDTKRRCRAAAACSPPPYSASLSLGRGALTAHPWMLVANELHAHDFVDRSLAEGDRRFIRLNKPMGIPGHSGLLGRLQALYANCGGGVSSVQASNSSNIPQSIPDRAGEAMANAAARSSANRLFCMPKSIESDGRRHLPIRRSARDGPAAAARSATLRDEGLRPLARGARPGVQAGDSLPAGRGPWALPHGGSNRLPWGFKSVSPGQMP